MGDVTPDQIPPCPHDVPHGEGCHECVLAASGEDITPDQERKTLPTGRNLR